MKIFLSILNFLTALFKKPLPPAPPVIDSQIQNPVAPPTPPDPDAPRKKLLAAAQSFLGKDASPDDVADDEFGCAETVTDIIHFCFGDFPKEGGTIISTTILNQKLKAHPKFKQTLDPKPGNIVISPTGQGNGKLKNGHTGIFENDTRIMSNDSASGLFILNYNLDTWVARYRQIGGFPIYIYERVEM